MPYHYRISRCSVDSKSDLRKFRKLRAQWIKWLHGPIRKDVVQMMSDDTMYLTINEARGYAHDRQDPEVLFNPGVSEFLDRGYVTTQLMIIRRLVSKRPSDISLHTLLTEIRKHRKLITREIYVSYDGLPYDYGPAKAAFNKRIMRENNGIGYHRGEPRGPKAWAASKRVHENFDRLSGVSPRNRSKDNQIQDRLFSDLFARLEKTRKMEQAASEMIAHLPKKGAGTRSLARRNKVSLRRLETAQKALCEVAAAIDGPLLWESSGNVVAIPQYDHLRGFGKKWVADEDMPKLYEYWQARAQIVDKWVEFDWP